MKKSNRRHKFLQKRRIREIDGMVISYYDYDPLGDAEKENIVPISGANQIFAEHREFIFKNQFKWVITVAPISVLDGLMCDAIEVIARCRIDELTDHVESYIEEKLQSLDLDMLKYWRFDCQLLVK